ncbi:response regulator [Marivirga sp. S37H4]|uniref:histidine kinase n=1 Tax=Marivirga aurantiaca TaxID=2802615 RepID=A0A934WZI8_9BACT|nr:response regulator [Marivirga aurantiaca]MBK6265757.1 response regulator [Marivirga aurantiaca]
MGKDPYPYRILVIEDNPGDYLLIQDYLDEHILSPKIKNVGTFRDALMLLSDPEATFDIILLDLSLPDKSSEELINEIVKISKKVPIIALTGYSELAFAVKSLSLGLSDYLVKEELSPIILYKSIVYNIERNRYIKKIRSSEKKYMDLFQMSPLPMWVYDSETLKFLDVNESAVRHYGYSVEEFTSMSIKDIRPKEDMPDLEKALEISRGKKTGFYYQGVFRHVLKNGEIIYVDIQSNVIKFNERDAKIVLANDITDRIIHTKTIEVQNEKLKEVAWLQSHIVRAPLSRIMGLLNVLSSGKLNEIEKKQYLGYAIDSANELDSIVRDVVSKSQQIHLDPKKNEL